MKPQSSRYTRRESCIHSGHAPPCRRHDLSRLLACSVSPLGRDDGAALLAVKGAAAWVAAVSVSDRLLDAVIADAQDRDGLYNARLRYSGPQLERARAAPGLVLEQLRLGRRRMGALECWLSGLQHLRLAGRLHDGHDHVAHVCHLPDRYLLQLRQRQRRAGQPQFQGRLLDVRRT